MAFDLLRPIAFSLAFSQLHTHPILVPGWEEQLAKPFLSWGFTICVHILIHEKRSLKVWRCGWMMALSF